MLQLIKEKIDISEMLEGSVKISTIHQSLIRKGLITDQGDELTLIGKELLEFIDTPMINWPEKASKNITCKTLRN